MTCRRHTYLFLLVSAILAVVIVIAPAASSADQIQLNYTGTVVNASGVPQPDVDVYDVTQSVDIGRTDANGQILLSLAALCTKQGQDPGQLEWPYCTGPAAGDVITFSRSDQFTTDPCFTAPEGWPGVSTYDTTRVIQGTGGNASNFTVFLPTTAGTPYQPALSSEEEGMVGAINHYRVQNGLTPLTVSSVLTASADKYLSDLPARPLNYDDDSTYCMASGPGIRAEDAGFPTRADIGESVLQNDGNAYAAMTDLQNDPFQDALTNGGVTLIGIAQEGGSWVIDTSAIKANDPAYGRAGDTHDTGNYGLVASEFPGDQTDPAATAAKTPKSAQLKIAKIRVKARRIMFIGHLKAGAKGSVSVIVKRANARTASVLKAKRVGSKVSAVGKVKKAGRYVLVFDFAAKSGTLWQDTNVKRTVTVR